MAKLLRIHEIDRKTWHAAAINGHTKFNKLLPLTQNEAVYRIEELTGIKRSPTQVRKFLKSMGMKCIKVGSLPSKADRDEQEDYKEKKLEPRLNEAKEGKRAVFFVDAAHFVMGAFLGFVWCFERLFVKSPSGRKRFNVLGALNAITHEVILVTNDTYITATQVCELRSKIAALGLMIPITLVLDNARYQKCKIEQHHWGKTRQQCIRETTDKKVYGMQWNRQLHCIQ